MTSDNFQATYGETEPARDEIDALTGVSVVEFGSPGCSICKSAQRDIQAAIRESPHVRHVKVEDGSGQPLGRSFRVRLWPTLVVMKDGVEIARVVRPSTSTEIKEAIAKAA